MDRSRTKEFQDFALLLEGCFRAYAEKLAVEPPKTALRQEFHRAFPFAQCIMGDRGAFQSFLSLDPQICHLATLDGREMPAISDIQPVAPPESASGTSYYSGGVNDSARILGRIEKGQHCEVSDLFERWLAAERRRDTPYSRKLFVDAVARRVLTMATISLPGAGAAKIEPDKWRYVVAEEIETDSFVRGAAEVFAAAGEAENQAYSLSERFTDRLLGARLCGHVEGMALFPMHEIIARLTHGVESKAHTTVAEEFGRAIAASALDHPNLWTSSTDAIVPGLHEHLSQFKAGRDPDAPTTWSRR